jgi:hypothetical protein
LCTHIGQIDGEVAEIPRMLQLSRFILGNSLYIITLTVLRIWNRNVSWNFCEYCSCVANFMLRVGEYYRVASWVYPEYTLVCQQCSSRVDSVSWSFMERTQVISRVYPGYPGLPGYPGQEWERYPIFCDCTVQCLLGCCFLHPNLCTFMRTLNDKMYSKFSQLRVSQCLCLYANIISRCQVNQYGCQ